MERRLPTIRRQTKSTVQRHLKKGAGVDKGIYKRSFKIHNFAESKWHIGFQVFAKAPHYRLTHLIEGSDTRSDGLAHKIYAFTRGKGKMTKKGNIGMSWIKTAGKGHGSNSGYTRAFKHIKPGQEFADEKVFDLYEQSLMNKFEERKR